jgi:LysM repeat protein
MTPDKINNLTKICPTCGTRVSEKAAKCVVCGTSLGESSSKVAPKPVQGSRMPELTLSLPLALGLLALFVTIGAAAVYFTLSSSGRVIEPTPIPSATTTATLTLTPTSTETPTPQPTYTPIPPIEYTIASNDSCLSIALAFDVSFQSIILLNNLPASCNNLVIGQKILVPRPTPTPTSAPSATLSAGDATEAACEKYVYTVKATDTLFGISLNFNVPMDAIKEYNGLPGDYVYEGQILNIPTCKRNPTPGPSPTATTPPPYQPPNLLLPPDGASFTLANDSFTLQWAAVGELRGNEFYGVTVVDLTDPNQRRLTDYVTDTKFIVPPTFRPNDTIPHVMKWWVVVVRQTTTDAEGKAVYESAGLPSEQRAFSWIGSAISTTPQP